MGKTSSKTKQKPEAELLLFETCSLSSSTLSSKNNRRYSKKCRKDKWGEVSEVFSEIISLMTMQIRLKK